MGRNPIANRPTVDRIDVERRRRFVLDIVAGGATYAEAAQAVIAQGLAPKPRRRADGSTEPRYRRSDAYLDCQAAMMRITEQPARELKAKQMRRLDQAQRAMLRDVTGSPDPMDRARAATALSQLMAREAKLCGLDETVRTEIEITTHLDAVAALTITAALAAIPLADLSEAQAAALIEGMRTQLAGLQRDEPKALESGIIDAELVDEPA